MEDNKWLITCYGSNREPLLTGRSNSILPSRNSGDLATGDRRVSHDKVFSVNVSSVFIWLKLVSELA